MIRFPPIAALRAFESASRHLNYTRAAEELHVTQSAISHQIKHIEELWGIKLFNRQGRGIELTDHAKKIAPVINEFLVKLNHTISNLNESNEDEGFLRVALSQSFALKWMVPRLGDFSHQYPDIDVTIITMPLTNQLEFNDADIAIFFSDGNHEEFNVIRLLRGYSFAVCSPDFFKNEIKTLKRAQDILNLPILRRLNIDAAPRWRDWFAVAGVDNFTLPKGVHFPNSSMALQAAIDGQGIALARSSHVADDLQSGRLVKLLDIHVESPNWYNLIIPENKMKRKSAQKFIAWIKDEAMDSQELFDLQAKTKGLRK